MHLSKSLELMKDIQLLTEKHQVFIFAGSQTEEYRKSILDEFECIELLITDCTPSKLK